LARATYTAAQRGRYVVLCETGGASSRVGRPCPSSMRCTSWLGPAPSSAGTPLWTF